MNTSAQGRSGFYRRILTIVERYFPEDTSMQQALKSASLRELETLWRIIDDALEPGAHFIGENYSLCDMLFLMQAVWVENQPADLSRFLILVLQCCNAAFDVRAVIVKMC